MKYLNHIISNSSVTVIYEGGITKVVSSSNRLYGKITDLIRNRRFEEIEAEIDTINRINKSKRINVDKETRKVLIDGENAPQAMVKVLEGLIASGENTKPLIRFWDKLKQNPNSESVARLYDFLMANHNPITDDGDFIAYKYVRHDFKDVHSGKYDNSPGQTVEMPRENCDSDSSVTCSRGLHAAAFEYASSGGSKMVLVKINPRDVVAVPYDYNNQKMRVCKYYVVEEYKEKTEMKVAKMSVKKAYYLIKLRTKKLLVDKKEIVTKKPITWLKMVTATNITSALKQFKELFNQNKKKSIKKVTKKIVKKTTKKSVKKTKSKKS